MGFEKFSSSRAQDFIVIDEIFRNHAGSIAKVQFKYDNQLYVLKEIAVTEGRSRRNAINEVNLLQQLNHPNVIRFYGHFWDDSKRNGMTQSLFMVLEYCECGDLGRLVAARRASQSPLEEAFIWRTFHQICLGVQHLHQNGIVHRDLKGLNILLVNNGRTAKVADLGVSRQVAEDESMLKTFQGTPLYLSPELVDGSHYTEKTDIWSLGVLLYELCMLTPPFRAQSISGLGQAIKAGQYPPLSPQYSPSLSRVIASLLNQDFTKRPTITQLVERVEHHMKPENAKEKLERVVTPSPRPDAPSEQPPEPQQQEPHQQDPQQNDMGGRSVSHSSQLSKGEGKESRSRLKPAGALVEPIEKSAYVRRSIMDEGNMGAPVSKQPVAREYERRSGGDERARGAGGSSGALDEGGGAGMVRVDVNRLSVHERREKTVLRKLLQAKGLMTSGVVSDGMSGNNSGRSSAMGSVNYDDRVDGGGPDSQALSASLALEQKIARSQEVISLLEEAIVAGGLISAENATKCNLPLSSDKPLQSRAPPPPVISRGGVSPIRHKAWPPSCMERARQETPPTIEVNCNEERVSPQQKAIFQENKNSNHSNHFSVFADQGQRPSSSSSSSSSSQQRPYSQPATTGTTRPSSQNRPKTAAGMTHQQQQRQKRQEQQKHYFQHQQQQQQRQQQEFRQLHSSGSASRHVQQQRQQQRMQQEGRYNHRADSSGSGRSSRSSTSDMLSHREEVYGRPDVNSRGKRISGDGGGSPPINSRQFHRVSMLSPSREQQQQRQKRGGVKGRFNIISGEFEAE